jgi:hypothetical protein
VTAAPGVRVPGRYRRGGDARSATRATRRSSASMLCCPSWGTAGILSGGEASARVPAGRLGQPESVGSLAGHAVGYLRFTWTLAATLAPATDAMWALDVQVGLPRPVLVQVAILPFLLALGVWDVRS